MAKLLITIWDNDQTTILAPAGTVFEWNPNSTIKEFEAIFFMLMSLSLNFYKQKAP